MKRGSQLFRINPNSGNRRTPITAAIEAVTLDSEIILPRQRLPKNTIARQRQKTGANPKITPALVATALPPLNPAKHRKGMSNYGQKDQRREVIHLVGGSRIGRRVAKVPLKKSLQRLPYPLSYLKFGKYWLFRCFQSRVHADLFERRFVQSKDQMESNQADKLKLIIQMSSQTYYTMKWYRKSENIL